MSKKTPSTIQLSKFSLSKKSRRSYHVNYLQGFWLDLFRDIIKKFTQAFPTIPSLFKGRFSFKLRWEHIVIAFLLGALLASVASKARVQSTYSGLSLTPATISLKPLPLLKEASYKPQGTLQPVWIDNRRPIGTYANDYAPGNCTWYVASRLPVPNSMGNASNWAYAASLAGYTVSGTPQVGSIAQTSGDSYLGHVAIVESLNPDGSFVVSEMNYLGLGMVDSRTTTTAEFNNFIIV